VSDAVVRIPPLQGYLVRESETDLQIRTSAGTWVFQREDVVGISDWPDADSSFDGRGVCVEFRVGAVAEFCQTVRIEIAERPMTTAEGVPQSAGHEQLEELTRAWAVRINDGVDRDLKLVGTSWTSSATMTGTCGGGGWVDDYQPYDNLD
jgi:hypothetical protein